MTNYLGHNGGPAFFDASTAADDDADSPLRIRVIRIHINDWVASTRGLSCEEEGFFWRFNLLLYDRMGVLVDDDQMNARALSLDVRAYKRLKARLVHLGKIQIAEGKLSHPRVVREIENYVAEYKRRSASAKEREERRREAKLAPKIDGNSTGSSPEVQPKSARSSPEVRQMFTAHPAEVNGHLFEKDNKINGSTATTLITTLADASRARAFPKPKPKPLSEDSPYSPPMGDDPLDEAFEQFWAAFPPGRKQGKGGARDLFRLIVTGRHRKRRAKAADLIDGAKRYAATRPDPQYTPAPTTWLNQGRWEDEGGSPKVNGHASMSDDERRYRAILGNEKYEQVMAKTKEGQNG
jgi:uncharacterized protein YdaU (DUF1376 family)